MQEGVLRGAEGSVVGANAVLLESTGEARYGGVFLPDAWEMG
jgi:hypothetical protein